MSFSMWGRAPFRSRGAEVQFSDEKAAARPLEVRLELADLLVGGVLLAVSIWFYAAARRIEDVTGDAVGPGGFPRALSILFGALSLALVAGALRRLAIRRRIGTITIHRPLQVLAAVALVIGFPAAVSQLGHYPAMGLWLAAFLWLADCRRPVSIAAYVGAFLAFTKIVFELGLKTPLH
jgi:hypothetical protein